MTILQSLTEEMKVALKAQDAARLSAVRMLISAIKYALVDKPDLDEEGVRAVLSKEAKKRREAIEAYRSAGREERARAEEAELMIINSYLPQMMSEPEVRQTLEQLKQQLVGKNMGEAMKVAIAELKGRAESAVIAKVVKEMLT